MDIHCPICGEPWDTDELHDVVGVGYVEACRRFSIMGCGVFGVSHSVPVDKDTVEPEGSKV